MIAVLRHELRSAFNSLTIYLFSAALLAFVGIGAALYNIEASVAGFEHVLSFVSIGLVVIIPVLTMRSFAEERRQKTDQLLYSLPLSTWQIVGGKYLALVLLFLVPMLIVALYPYVFSQYGELYLPGSYGAMLAFLMLGAALIAVGMFLSSLTDSQGLAAGSAIALFLFNYFSVSLAEQVSSTALGAALALCAAAVLVGLIVRALTKSCAIACGVGGVLLALVAAVYLFSDESLESLLPDLMRKLSLFSRFSTIVSGVFDLTVLVFYGSVIALGLFLTVQSLEKRRYN